MTTPDALSLLLMASATWRLTHMLMYEAGPWHVVERLRAATGVRHDDDGSVLAVPDGNVFECFLCLSVWVAPIAVLAWYLLWPFELFLALSAMAIWLEGWYKRGTR